MKESQNKELSEVFESFLKSETCPSSKKMLLYREKLLPKSQNYKIENHIISCPICSLVFDIHSEFDSDPFNKIDEIFDKKVLLALKG